MTFAGFQDIVAIMELNKDKINKELKRLGWSKYKLGEKMGVNRQWIYQLMDRKYNGVTLKTIDKIAKALDFDPKDLIV